MPKPSSNAPRPTPFFARNRWISPRQAEMLDSLWNARLRRAGRRLRPERSRDEQLGHIAETVGRKVENPRELSWRDANRVLRRLLEEIQSHRTSRASDGNPTAVSGSATPSASPGGAAKRPRKTPRSPQAPTAGTKARRPPKNPRKGGRRSHD